MLRSITELVFAPHCSQPVYSRPQMCGMLTGAVGGQAVGADRAEELVAADPERVETAVALLGADRQRALQRRYVAQRS